MRSRVGLLLVLLLACAGRTGAQPGATPPGIRAQRSIKSDHGYILPPMEVEAAHLTLAELIDLAARRVEEQRKFDVPHRFTRHLRLLAGFGEPGEAGARREIFEQVTRVESWPGQDNRTVLLYENQEEVRGDSLKVKRQDVKAKARIEVQAEGFSSLPLELRGGDFRTAILERRHLSDRALLHIAYEPIEKFTPRPNGEVWLDTQDYVILRQTGSWRENVPMPMIIRAIESFRVRMRRYGPLWLEQEISMSILLRHGPRLPNRIDLQIQISGVELINPADPTSSIPAESAPEDQRVAAIMDSLAILDRDATDPLLLRPASRDLVRATIRGDSLLGKWRPAPALRLASWRPILHYNRVERLAFGLGVKFAARAPVALNLTGGYSAALKRGFGSTVLDLGKERPGKRWSAGAHLSAFDRVASFGGEPPPAQILWSLLDGSDPGDYYRSREILLEPWLGRRSELGLNLRLALMARAADHGALGRRRLWTVLKGKVDGDTLLEIDSGRIRAVGGRLTVGKSTHPDEPILTLMGETSGRALDGTLLFRKMGGTLLLRPLLPGGLRMVLRGNAELGSAGLPRQLQTYLGGEGSLRAYPAETLSGRSAYHVGGELHLNQDLVGWLPGVPNRGLGTELFLAADYGGVISGARIDGNPVSYRPTRTSVGAGVALTVGLPGIDRLLLSIHRGVGRGDQPWALRLATE